MIGTDSMRFGLGKHVSKSFAEVWKAGDIMVSSNKILTVSYGTFSCTLEGFDNSFDTMKAIAEYFRDLAQDDRYFGAEPPTPDAEMLARIAEREIARRVEARFEKGNLVLRPSDDAEPPRGDVAPQSSKDAALADATASVAATALAVAAQPADAQTVSSDTSVEDTEVDISEMEFADLEAVVDSEEDTAPEDDGVTIDLSDISLDTDDVDVVAFSADDVLDAEETAIAESSIDDLIAEQDDKENRRIAAEAAEVEAVEAEAAPVVADSVAEKLQRIRAVVASKAQPAPEYIEDEHAMSGPDGDGNDKNNAIDVEETAALDDNLFTDTIAAVVSDQLDLDDEDEEEAFLPDADFDDEDDEDYAPVAARRDDAQSELEILRAKIAELEAQAAAARASETVAVEQAEQPDVIAQQDEDENDDLELLSDDDDDEDDLNLVSDDEDDDELFADDEEDDSRDKPYVLQNTVMDDDETDEEEAAAPQPLIARVGKAKRADVEAALASGQLEEYDDEDEDDAPVAVVQPVPGLEDSSLTPEQEAELARELADLHAEIEEDEDWDFDDDEDDFDNDPLSEADQEAASANIRKAVKLTSPARAMLTDKPIEEDTDSVERLVGKTDSAMEEPEGNRRRSAIAHLRAAVAATKADRLLGFGKKTVNEEQPYREDLADAVRPRRPKVTEARSARPAPVRPAPLTLVAEQRIDVDGDKAATPVRPRRVLRNVEQVEAADATAADDTGFAEFAENQGAHTLPELLEAAAAYMSFVEGRDQFSRPQLMTKLLQAEGAASSREERLRSFGQLLREGKIEKKSGGRFAASDSIGFKPDARAAG